MVADRFGRRGDRVGARVRPRRGRALRYPGNRKVAVARTNTDTPRWLAASDGTDYLASPCEETRVFGWRLRCFQQTGCPQIWAELLALSTTDRALVERALRAGCDPERLVDLLLD